MAILASAWLAAGSVGLVGTALLRTLSWTALAAAVILLRPPRRALAWLAVIVAVLVGLPFVISAETFSLPGYDILLATAVASVLASARCGTDRRAIVAAALAVAALAVFRIGCDCIPMLWHVADSMGYGLGTLAAASCGRELWVGSTFGGVDFLVAMAAFSTVWLWHTPPPRLARVVYVAAAIVAVEFVYLFALSHVENLIAALPDLPPPPSADPAEYRPPDWSAAAALRDMMPCCLPLIALAGNLLVAAAMLRWTQGRSTEGATDCLPDGGGLKKSENTSRQAAGGARIFIVTVVAAAAAVVLTCAVCPSGLSGKKIVAYADADVWALPEHSEYDLAAADGYGMLPSFVAALGGKCEVAKSLNAGDLQDADVLIMLDPVKPLNEETLARVHDFVRGGGSLLLLAGPASAGGHDRAAVDALLEPTGMGVRFDVAVAKTPHWQDAARVFVHPATVAVNQQRNQCGLNLGSSIATRNSGQPLLVGRWGWCEPGSDMASAAYGQGEKLGDVVLAAENRLGDGTIVVLSDTTGLTNIGLVGGHPFAGRLLGYLAARRGNPRVWWRQFLGVVLSAILVWLIVGRAANVNSLARLQRLSVAAVAFAMAMVVSAAIGREVGKVLPDGRLPSARPIAYIDAAHFGVNGDEPWVAEGTGGFAVALMRNGYMPLAMYEMDEQRLDRAAMLTVVGPGKPFSKSERQAVARFVDGGGLLVCSVGAEESPAARGLLADFKFAVPHSPVAPGEAAAEPAPIGRFPDEFGRVLMAYLNAKDYGRGDYMVYTWFHQPWPVKCSASFGEVSNLAFGHQGRPIAVHRKCGDGNVVVIGDSHFALNENLGYVDGRADEGVLPNLDFWRWCLGRATGSHDWFPPDRQGDARKKQEEPSVESPPLEKPPKSQDAAQEKTQTNPLRPAEVKP